MNSTKKIHFEISERKILLRVMDVFSSILTLTLIGYYTNFHYFRVSETNFYWTIVLAFYISFFGTIFEMYNLQIASNRFQISKSIILTTSVTVLFYLLTPFYTPILPSNRLQILLFFFSILFSLSIWRYIYIVFLASNRFMKEVIFVCNSKDINDLLRQLATFNPHYKVVGYVAIDEVPIKVKVKRVLQENLDEFVRKNNVSEIVVSTINNKLTSVDLYNKLLQLLEKGVVIRKYNQVYENTTYRLPINFEEKELYKFFPFSRSNQNKFFVFYTRFFDIFFSTLGLIFFFFIAPFLWIINLFANNGSFFYTQVRVGKNGIPFTIYKMRTMVQSAEKNGAVFAVSNDSRITPFGKFLRKSRLDEFPQFINVLKGEMSIIGPRPERPIFVDQIAASIPLYQTRHVIKPGLTGWAQVNYPYGSNLEDSLMKLRYDLYYIKHRSLFLDVDIVIKTMSTVLFFRGQ
ncbi:MAG: exopolysaccharide biosynthesis polyprenyl glycosylphosphotransferase [Flavobacterium sp.]|nr:exopolysaccharide biosynthesis polyprenyl glycosylphosphotransferase [Flavobacterium sp.]